ncbi:MAG: universal stress protein [Pseudomonadota bacterium]
MASQILVPIDIHEESSWREILPIAFERARSDGADLTAMTVVQHVEINMPGVLSPEKIYPQLRAAAGERLGRIVGAFDPGELKIDFTVGEGSIYREILRVADEIGADLIILASHRPALSDYLLGAQAARVVRHAKCSVYVVRPA